MLDAKPTIFISHSSKFKDQVAVPFRDHIESLGMKAVLVEEMPLPAEAGSEPEAKVEYFLQGADMFVALLTPDDRLEGGEIRSRPNIADEIGRAKSLPHLRRRIQVFKSPEVVVHSNINPTRESLDVTNPSASFAAFERQAIEWGVMPRSAGVQPTSAAGPIGPAEVEQAGESRGDRAARQAGQALEELRLTLLGRPSEDAMSRSLAIRRAHIAVSTELSSLTSGSIYGVHELNGLYRDRTELRLANDEIRHLFRSVVRHSDSDTGPGWFWLRTATAEESHEILIDLACDDPDPATRAKAMQLLAKSHRRLAPRTIKRLVESGMQSGSSGVRPAALEILAAKGSVRLLREISASLGPDSAEAVLEVRSRETPSAALAALVADSYSHNEEIERLLLAHPRKLSARALHAGLTAPYYRTRLLCLRGLDRSRRLQTADVTVLFADNNSKVRDEALRIASRNEWSIEQGVADKIVESSELDLYATTDLQLSYFATVDGTTLTKRLTWIGSDGWNVYAALGLRGGSQAAERARKDLDSEFAAMRAEYKNSVRRSIEGKIFSEHQEASLRKDKSRLEELIEREVDTFFGRYDHLDPFTLKRFQASALRILSSTGQVSDARYARDLLFSNEQDVVLEAMKLLRRFGDPKDAPKIVDAAGQLYFENRLEGARIAAEVADDKAAISSVLLSNGDNGLRMLGIETLEKASREAAEEALVPLLNDDTASIRSAAVDQLCRRMSRTRSRKLLNVYPEQSYYYYNVMARLDRALYAPGWFRNAHSGG